MHELANLCAQLGTPVTEEELRALMELLDEDANGTVEYEELHELVQRFHEYQRKNRTPAGNIDGTKIPAGNSDGAQGCILQSPAHCPALHYSTVHYV